MGLAQGISQTNTTNARLAERVGRENHWTGLPPHTFAQTQRIGTHTTDGRGERYILTSYETWLHEGHKKHIINQERGPGCCTCGKLETRDHMLIHCRHYQRQRRWLFEDL